MGGIWWGMRKPQRVKLTLPDRAELERWSRARTLLGKQRLRARVLLMADEGKDDTAIAAKLCASRQRCGRIRARFLAEGLKALVKDRPRPGRPRQIDPQRILTLTRDESPDTAAVWSQNLMAKKAGVSASSVRRIWKTAKIKFRVALPKVGDEPRFAERLEAIVGLYLAPPIRALVLCKGMSSRTEALTRVPRPQGRRRTPTLSAALNTLDETLCDTLPSTGLAGDGRRELLRFLQQFDTQMPADQKLHLFIGDGLTRARFKEFAQRHKLPPPPGDYEFVNFSWRDMVLRLVRTLTTRPLRQGMIQSMAQLQTDITAHLAAPKAGRKPFSWTAKVADFRAKAALNTLQD
ncbi:MAG: helix-turn-helix domain-containing protein [Limisphaerales bacterium]